MTAAGNVPWQKFGVILRPIVSASLSAHHNRKLFEAYRAGWQAGSFFFSDSTCSSNHQGLSEHLHLRSRFFKTQWKLKGYVKERYKLKHAQNHSFPT